VCLEVPIMKMFEDMFDMVGSEMILIRRKIFYHSKILGGASF
jgi:hypothetical protein